MTLGRVEKMSTRETIIPHNNDKRPIAKFYRSWLDDTQRGISPARCRGINQAQFQAADRLINNYQRAFLTGGRNYAEVSFKREYFRHHQLDGQVQALRCHEQVFSRLSQKSREILEHFCLQELTIRQYELKQVPQWPKGAGTARLREALDDLVKIYHRLNLLKRG